jgi:Ran-binding protein 3
MVNPPEGNDQASAPKSAQLASPARSDRSSDSEGRPVRQKLKETRIDAPSTADQAPSADQAMTDAAVNGQVGGASNSGSDNERGRLRRKRSREDLEDVSEDAKPLGKKHERHTRKKSRDITSPLGSDTEVLKKKPNGSIAPIAEDDGDANAASASATASRQATPDAVASDKGDATVTSPKNKRKLEQTPSGATKAAIKPEERDTKRPRDGVDSAPVSKVVETTSKVYYVPSYAQHRADNPPDISRKWLL